MGLFDELEEDFHDVDEPQQGIPAGTYEAMVSAIEVEEKPEAKRPGKYLVFSYTVTEEGPYKGMTQKEWKHTIQGRAKDDADRQDLAYLKQRLANLGVPEERMNSVEVDDIVGTEIAMTLVDQKNNPQYRNVSRISLLAPVSDSTETLPDATQDDGDDPFADV